MERINGRWYRTTRTAKTQSGEMRHSIILQTNSGSTQDTFGAETQTWTTALTTWASIKPFSGKELERAQQVAGEVSHKITIRYWSSLTRNHRVLFGSRVFDINYINNIGEQSVFQELFCKEAV